MSLAIADTEENPNMEALLQRRHLTLLDALPACSLPYLHGGIFSMISRARAVRAPVYAREGGSKLSGLPATHHALGPHLSDPAGRLAPTIFEREFEKLEPVPQAPDADIDLALGE